MGDAAEAFCRSGDTDIRLKDENAGRCDEVRRSNYDKEPTIHIDNRSGTAWQGYPDILGELRRAAEARGKKRLIIGVDCYPGVRNAELFPRLVEGLRPVLTVDADALTLPKDAVRQMLRRNVTDDRVFGVLSCHRLEEFLDPQKLKAARERIDASDTGWILVYGTGAAHVASPDLLIYADLARWEIQQRYRSGELANWCCDNYEEEPLRKFKRGYFVDWRIADRHKKSLFAHMDYVLDTNLRECPKMMRGETVREGYRQTVRRPFRVVPYFDPGVWGGQWMKETCDLPRNKENYAWAFDCVPEENSLYLECDGIRIELPSINLVFTRPVELLGDRVHARFGTEFPIRFDFLDTMGGQNLSLQVHPLTEYIQETFGMHYTQDESYYLLDAKEGAGVYLGLKEDADADQLLEDLEQARETGRFDAEQYINRIPAKKHDHFLIPAGTVHCSGADTMVLEISATPYIFTFKLWDWNRVGLDGRPRPVHLEHGARNIRFERRTGWVMKNLCSRVEKIGSGDGWEEERTGLHEREFIETRRHWFTKPVLHHTGGGVNVLNLVEGEEAVVLSPEGAFEPFVVHYAETFIVPAAVGAYVVAPTERSRGGKLATVKAYVRI